MEEESLITKVIKPVVKETYAILLEGESSFIAEVTDVNTVDNLVVFQNTNTKKENTYLLKDDELVLQSDTARYKILDIERVIPFDLSILKEDIQQLNKQLTSDIIEGLDISLEEIQEKDKIYTPVELREDILSSLVKSFDAYDNLMKIKLLNDTVDNLLHLTETKEQTVYLYNIQRDKPLPKWLLPVVDNPMNVYEDSEKGLLDFYTIKEDARLPYQQEVNTLLDTHRPIAASMSDIGYYTNTMTNYLRDCLITSTCLSTKGSYRYDMRRNKLPNQYIHDGETTIYHHPDSMNVIGFLHLSENELRHTLPFNYDLFNLKEMTFLNLLLQNVPYQTLKESPLLPKTYADDLEIDDLDQNIFYSFQSRYESKEDYYSVLQSITPPISKLIGLIQSPLKQTIMNYKDFKTLCIQYEIDPYSLLNDDVKQINQLITQNVESYLTTVPTLNKIVIDGVVPELTLTQKIKVSLDIILSMTNIPQRNEYLQKFIRIYTRQNTNKEEPQWLYNRFNNQPLLCKHYELLSVYHNNKDAFNTMVTLYGRTPEDGVVHCKHCGEYLCNEDFSLFDGFSDEQPIVMREELVNDVNLLESFKENDILLVKQIAGSLGVSLTDEDIKLVLDIQKPMSDDILANIRYQTKNITVSDEHPFIQESKKKHAKDKNRKKLMARDIKEFQQYIKDTNKVTCILSLLMIIVQSSVPAYELKKKSTLQFIEFNDRQSLDTITYNTRYIDFSILNTVKLCDSYRMEPIWFHYKQVSDEYKQYQLPQLRQQLLNIVHYIVSPQYPIIQERLQTYRTHLLSTTNVYINYEWPLYKPLLNSKLSTTVNDTLVDKDPFNKKYYILNYNNYPVENISLIHDIQSSQNELIHDLVGLKISEIMVNKAFLLLFSLSVSNYGSKRGVIHGIDLHIERFLQTVKKQDEMRAIFAKHKWESSLRTGALSYKTLRTSIIPEIIAYYLKVDTDLSPCFDNEKMCNQFIHMNVNNYDLHMFKAKPKRIYKYTPFTVYPTGSFEELSNDFKQKLFKKYCRDPSGEIIKRFITTDYLGKYLVDTPDDLEEEYLSVYEQSLRMDVGNFKDIMKAVQCEMPRELYIQPKNFTIEDYTSDIYMKNTSTIKQLYETITQNQNFDLEESHPLLTTLSTLVSSDIKDPKNLMTVQRQINKSYSSLDKEPLISAIASFITNVTDKKQVKRFESIFVNTTSNININKEERLLLEGEGFRYKNMRSSDISKVFDVFLMGDKLTTDICYNYIYMIRSNLANLSVKQEYPLGISQCWRLSKNNNETFKSYLLENRSLLHQDIFRRNSINPGFYKYKEPLLFQSVFESIQPYLNQLDLLRKNDPHFINPIVSLLLLKYVLVMIFSKLIEFHDDLVSEDSELITTIEERYLRNEEEFNSASCASILESYIMDLLINMFEIHYDSRWVVSNLDLDGLQQRLSKQREKEKQQLIQNLDTMSDEKRASTVELQKIGVTSMYHQAMRANEQRIIDEYSMVDEGYDEIDNKDIVDAAVSISTGEIQESAIIDNNPFVEEEGQGYYNENDFDEDGVLGDELHELSNMENLFDNDFNV